MALYNLHLGTQAEYAAKLDAKTLIADDLYFTSDTLCIYKGDKLLSASVEAVTEFPQSGAQGRIYVNSTTLEAKAWDGSKWTVISPAVSTTLNDQTEATDLVTAGAIRSYVAGKTTSNDLVKDFAYNSTTQVITITYADDTTENINLENLITGVAYDGTTGNFTFSKANGQAQVVNTPVEDFLASASYDAATHILTLTMTSGDTVTVDLGDLIDTYVGSNGTNVNVAVNNGTISADVNISSTAGNILESKNDGLYVPAAAADFIQSVEDTATIDLGVDANAKLTAAVKISDAANNIITSDANGVYAQNYVKSVAATTTATTAVDASGQLTVTPIISNTANNMLTADANGLYVAANQWQAI